MTTPASAPSALDTLLDDIKINADSKQITPTVNVETVVPAPTNVVPVGAAAPEAAPPVVTVAASTKPKKEKAEIIYPSIKEYMTVHDFLKKYSSLIENCSILDTSNIQRVPVGKHTVFVTKHENDADFILFSNAIKLGLKEFKPNKIVVQNSGIIVYGASEIAFFTKTNVYVYQLINSCAVSCVSYKKVADTSELRYENATYTIRPIENIEDLKLNVNHDIPRLNLKEKNTRKEIREAVLNFITTIVDVNYFIKIYDRMIELELHKD